MKVKDLSQPLLSGRMGNLIYYVRNGVQCVRRAEVPGKKRKKERSDQQKGVTGRFAERGSLWISSILLLRRGPCFCQGD